MRFLSFLLLFGLAAFAASAPFQEEWEWKSEVVERDIKLKEGLNKILDMIRKHIDIDKIKEYIEERFKESKLREILLEKIERLKEKLKESEILKRIHDLIRKIFNKEEEDRESRSLKQKWEQFKEWLQKFHLKFKEAHRNFVEWLKKQAEQGLDLAKGKIELLKEIALKLKDHAKEISEETMREGMDFLRPYKEDLGKLWENLKDVVRDLKNKED